MDAVSGVGANTNIPISVIKKGLKVEEEQAARIFQGMQEQSMQTEAQSVQQTRKNSEIAAQTSGLGTVLNTVA